MRVTGRNLWGNRGSALEAQRADLWKVDLTNVYSNVKTAIDNSVFYRVGDAADYFQSEEEDLARNSVRTFDREVANSKDGDGRVRDPNSIGYRPLLDDARRRQLTAAQNIQRLNGDLAQFPPGTPQHASLLAQISQEQTAMGSATQEIDTLSKQTILQYTQSEREYINSRRTTGELSTAARSDVVLKHFNEQVQGSLPPPDFIDLYAQSVTLPSPRIAPIAIPRGSTPYNMPDFDEAVGAVKMVFLFDLPLSSGLSAGSESAVGVVSGGMGSRIYTLLTLWRALARSGLGGCDGEIAARLKSQYTAARGGPGPGAQQVSYIPPFKANVDVTLFAGATRFSPINAAATGASQSTEQDRTSFEGGVLNTATTLRIVGAWCSSCTISDLDYTAGNKLLTVTAEIFCDNVIPVATGVTTIPSTADAFGT